MKMKFKIKRLSLILVIAFITSGIGSSYSYVNSNIPDNMTIVQNDEEVIPLTFGKDAEVDSKNVGNYRFDIKLFGILTIKKVDVNVVENMSVYCGGVPIGMYLQTDGVMVIGSGKVSNLNGNQSEPALGLVKEGDYIIRLNGIDVSSKSQLIFLINQYGNKEIVLTIRRNGEEKDIKLKPVQTTDKEYKLGIWVRDDTQGIGTITYITEDMRFGALGHGISDSDTGKLLDSRGGVLYRAIVWGIEKGVPDTPGGICGYINYDEENKLGNIYTNCNKGIYGYMTCAMDDVMSQEMIEVSYKQDIKEGKAYIRSYVSGEAEDYEIEITKLNINGMDKDLVIKVTDERLLELTGGIVQGMSGSPIIQNGKLIGAVTHVLVDDPARGYGIFIERMLEN
ncbi:MAG: SpoIVB peptidase [Lachnospiraceae bacterium]|nr:SpoIVB peptidase [Lachnospiraceae bacterium]